VKGGEEKGKEGRERGGEGEGKGGAGRERGRWERIASLPLPKSQIRHCFPLFSCTPWEAGMPKTPVCLLVRQRSALWTIIVSRRILM